MTEIAIQLHNSTQDVYLAGDKLQGTVEVTLDSEKKFKEFYILITGTSYCSFMIRTHNTYQHSSSAFSHFEGSDVLLKKKIPINIDNGSLGCGTHRFDFQFELPKTLSPSLEAKHGHIRYKVEAILDVPWRLNKKNDKKITITRHVDMTLMPELKTPAEVEEMEQFCCFCCVSDHFIMTVKTPCLGFVAGQTLNFRVEYGNKSNVEIKATRAVFKKCMKYISNRPMTTEYIDKENLLKASFDGVREHEDTTVACSIQIPENLALTNILYSKVVQVSYELEVRAVSSGFHRDIVLCVPITIGTVPIDLSDSEEISAGKAKVMTVQPYQST